MARWSKEIAANRAASASVARAGLARGGLAGFVLLAWGLGSAAGCAGSETETSPPTTAAQSSGAGGDGGAGGAPEKPPCPVDCTKLDTPPCHVALCNEAVGTCFIIPSMGEEPCDDGLFCTVGEFCKNGVCSQGSDNPCGMAPEPCNDVVCDEELDACSLQPFEDGTACASDDLCAVNETCKAGVCKGVAKDCFFAPVLDSCHATVCNSQTGSCEPVPANDGLACPDDGDPCMLNKTCQGGLCLGTSEKNCSALTAGCFEGVCDGADGQCKTQPIAEGSACDEAADECNEGACDAAGSCVPVPTPGVPCASKADACNVGTCDVSGACLPAAANDGAACEDGDPCTTGETCASGGCFGGVLNNYVVYYSEPFATDMTGWTLGPEWQIGPAAASACSNKGSPDPASDHTPTADNGIAGVAIGGCPQKGIHGLYYLESPPIDVDVPGSVWLEFQRWLNSDFKPYMRNTIEVWSGSEWVLVWESGGPPAIADAGWTRVAHDLTAYKGSGLRVRFGFEVQNTQGFTVSGWNIDDVVIANNICE